jgi:uncharacterized protein (TIGR02145 family)
MDNRSLDFARDDETTVNKLKKIYMKKKLLLMMMCCPALLAAQGNGVKVSYLAVSAGSPSTVTFNVSWNREAMPVALWSDTVWVFVDYNNNGKMERLPVTGATLTATSAPDMGKVVEDAGNNQGMWVVGNARNAGAFTATVQLFTEVKNVAGACAYASNYPPVGEYTSAAKISFTGTPPYELLLAKASAPGETEQVESGNKFLLPCNYTVTSFTDATGAPGIMGKSSTATAPGRTVDFTAFDPDPDAAIGTVWYLTDTREKNNQQTYKVKKMQDGRIWMVQDMKFGDKCNKTAFTGSSSNQTSSKLTSISGYIYGDCRNNTQADAGYLYDWAAAIQKADAYYGSTSNVGCSGISAGTVSPNPGACQGICPVGWHIPTGDTDGEFYDLHRNYNRGCSSSNSNCWNAHSDWEGTLGGSCTNNGVLYDQGSLGRYRSSTYHSNNYAYYLVFSSVLTDPGTGHGSSKYSGRSVRCVRNY